MTDRKQTQRSRKGSPSGGDSGRGRSSSPSFTPTTANVSSKRRAVTKAADLSLDQQLAVLDEATELPPFGFNLQGLEKRLQRRLGFKITQVGVLPIREH